MMSGKHDDVLKYLRMGQDIKHFLVKLQSCRKRTEELLRIPALECMELTALCIYSTSISFKQGEVFPSIRTRRQNYHED